MTKLIKLAVYFAINFCLLTSVYASYDFGSQELLALEQTNSKSAFKTAGVYWLPDYTYGTSTITNTGNTESPNSCAYYSQKSSIPLKHICTKTTPKTGLTCYKDCRCPPAYQYYACPNGKKVNADCCNNRCTACVDCVATGGWSYARPNVDESRIRQTTQTCGAVYYTCSVGYRASQDSILGTSGNISSKHCTRDQNYITTNGGYGCAKCADKTCSDFNLLDEENANMLCTVKEPYSNKFCYKCIACTPIADETNCKYGTDNCGDDCGGTRQCCVSCAGAQKKLIDRINTKAPGTIAINSSIVFCPNTGLVLHDGQHLVGGKGVQLTFNFDTAEKAIGIELANNSSISDLAIDYTTLNRVGSTEFNAIRNNKKTGTTLKNINLTLHNNSTTGGTTLAAILNLGSMKFTGYININIPSATCIGNYAISGNIADPTLSTLVQDKDSVLHITTYGNVGVGLGYITSNMSGTSYIQTKGLLSPGTAMGTLTITETGTVNILTLGAYSSGIHGTNIDIINNLNVQTTSATGDALLNVKGVFRFPAKVNIETKYKDTYTIRSSVIIVDPKVKIGLKTNSAHDSGLFATGNQTMIAYDIYTLATHSFFTNIAPFPGIPEFHPF